MARRSGPRQGVLDPTTEAIREGYVLWREASVLQWWTSETNERWEAELALWLAGESMVCSTDEMFRACMAAGLTREADRFMFTADHDQTRHWLVPGSEGGPVVECNAEGMPL
ncbi:hypothetical protein [Humibacter sp.]|uniref:hypothetical protein n=1 Tax=Humibacter sp. TaxID=1940291 RepID=UPI003F7CF5AE